jgi:transcriptional regulator with XRE-family HTH domain
MGVHWMTTSPTSTLSEPKGADKVPLSTLAYFRARLKHRIYSVIVKEFKRSGLTQADLGRRLNMEPAQLSRLLSGPGNLTLETVSDLLFTISAAELSLSTAYPLAARSLSTAYPLAARSHNFFGNQAKLQAAAPVPLHPAMSTTSRSPPEFIESMRAPGAPVPVAA